VRLEELVLKDGEQVVTDSNGNVIGFVGFEPTAIALFGFQIALSLLVSRYHVRRANWRAVIGWPPGGDDILMFWPSGFVEPWRPTLADIQANDWERAT
jgi:hypothetical protein